ncbi:adenylate/guanylate cyclase domain-containing protein [Labilibaculum sp. K2S]|uniref:adenylate/guanylate cyclase domain-containing protein n=1 Tax=Labilibaculum sp. K2S TaxID=3056386 RepID=UPI0025A3B8FE|nr:adenylate/guanylate cyclase domain-containing protein [Labilibaculum sp. K2S]MDM8160502.1 adenylate/guanylate cyclase domain-containing protein [Labilibaculum sp. K2S]
MGDFFSIDDFPATFPQLLSLYRSQMFYAILVYFFIVGSLIEIFHEIDRKLGKGILVKFLLGRYYKPKEEKRIFLFMDLKSSTYYAEKLGHFKYSRLIQDCFKDISDAVRVNHAQIYQYVGDEVVLTWKINDGIENLRCLQVFYDFLDILEKKKGYYQKTYGMIPIFKAGVHSGKVMVAEVGELKSEIAYHGDAINTASRIQGLCNSYESRLLISGDLLAELKKKNKKVDMYTFLGAVLLTGKKIPTELYSCLVN